MKHWVLLSSLILNFLVFCSSGFYKKENIFTSERLAIYFLDEEDYPEEEIKKYLPKLKKFPENAYDDIKFLFQSLYVEKESIYSKDTYPVFFKNQAEEILFVLKDIIPKTSSKKRILIVHKFDPFKTVLSKYKRITFLLWYDENGYNIVFGEIQEDLIPDNYSSDVNWLDIYPVSLKKSNPKQRILPNNLFEFKKIGDFTHHTWIISKPEQIANYKELNAPPTVEEKHSNKRSIEERLKKLKELYESNLITESEYESKKKEILKDL